APGALGQEEADIPTLTAYLAPADRATGAAIIICPGGGYHHVSPAHGEPVARWLNSIGVAGFVLKYRHFKYKHPGPFQDIQRAIRLVRARAEEWKLDPKRIGVMGFSAGGHLASMAAVHFDAGRPDAPDPIERVSSRPDLLILSVAVITMRPPFAHAGSVRNLLGENPPAELVAFCSTDEHVRPDTPPTFIVSSWSDEGVPVENSLQFAMALRRAKVPCEIHIYERGPHNFLLATGEVRRVLDTWWERLADWLRLNGFAAQTPAGPAPTWDYSQQKR
ncbi:MAG: alpha/beta hydrolase, partial [Thermoguttaceae bacterium]|nr:alpha/beta hydrolase [Thermoguttaceae bacterium]